MALNPEAIRSAGAGRDAGRSMAEVTSAFSGRFNTGAVINLVVACSLILLLGACAQTTALEPQNQALDARQGRLYFMRHPVIVGKLGSAAIKIDGKSVGALAAGDYIVADRPPGPHKVSVYGAIDSVGTESEVSIQPGISYYFELGPSAVRTNLDMMTLESMGITGQPLQGPSGSNSPYRFYALDAAAGAAKIARLNRQK